MDAPAAHRRVFWLAIAAVCALLCAAAIVRWNDWTYGSDTGTFAQTIANAFHGFTNGMEGGTHYRFHFSPLLAILWPLIAATRSPLALQFVQIALIIAVPILLAQITAAYVPSPWPERCGALALLYPPLLAAAFSEFHELAFYPAMLLALLLAADRARWLWFAVLALAIVLIREDASADLIVIGIVLAVFGALRIRTRERGLLLGEPLEPERLTVAGFALALLAAGSLAVYAWIVLPHAGAWNPSHFYDYSFARGPLQTILAIFTHPLALLAAIATTGRLTYILEALVPLALLPLFSRWSLLALPAFAGILLASDASVWRMGMHYVLLWSPLLLLGACWKLARMVRAHDDARALVWWYAALGFCAVFLIAFNPMHPAHYLRSEKFMHPADVKRALICVPHNAALALHDEWYAHEALAYPNSTVLGDRPDLFAGYIAYDVQWQNAIFERSFPALQAAQQSGALQLVCSSGTVRVLRTTIIPAKR